MQENLNANSVKNFLNKVKEKQSGLFNEHDTKYPAYYSRFFPAGREFMTFEKGIFESPVKKELKSAILKMQNDILEFSKY